MSGGASAVRKKIARRPRLCNLGEDAREMPPLLRRIYENRNVRARSELDYSLARLHPPHALKGIDAAAELLHSAIDSGKKILIIGDYDADGATATALAILGLRALGAACVEYEVPNRFEYGYGLSVKIAEVALAKHAPDLVVTVDNGISSVNGVACLRAAGVGVIITDHHLAGAALPDADAIVNPNQPGCTFPSKVLAGVGVMFYVLLALRARLRDAGRFAGRELPNLAEFLDLVALGTIADLVPLDANNRIFVAQGVARIRAGRCRAGIRALLDIAGRNRAHADSSALGFVIAPRINAAGRLDDIAAGIECLLTEDAGEAYDYARALDEMNRTRRDIEHDMQQRALQIIAQLDLDARAQCGFCLRDENWHHGVVGLVASRLREQFEQPAVVFAPDDDGRLRGSARSVEGLHMRDLLAEIAARAPGMVEKFGGHAMAAGLLISPQNYAEFAAQFHARVAAHFSAHAPKSEILTDGALDEQDFTLATAELMGAAAPWGQQFPPPLFDGEFRVLKQRVVGKQHLKMRMQPLQGTREFDAIAFRHVDPGGESAKLGAVHAVFELQAEEFRGARSLQLLVRYMHPLAE